MKGIRPVVCALSLLIPAVLPAVEPIDPPAVPPGLVRRPPARRTGLRLALLAGAGRRRDALRQDALARVGRTGGRRGRGRRAADRGRAGGCAPRRPPRAGA